MSYINPNATRFNFYNSTHALYQTCNLCQKRCVNIVHRRARVNPRVRAFGGRLTNNFLTFLTRTCLLRGQDYARAQTARTLRARSFARVIVGLYCRQFQRSPCYKERNKIKTKDACAQSTLMKYERAHRRKREEYTTLKINYSQVQFFILWLTALA